MGGEKCKAGITRANVPQGFEVAAGHPRFHGEGELMIGSGVNRTCELPDNIFMYDPPRVMCGAMLDGFDIGRVHTDDRLLMTLKLYTTPDLIHGLYLWAVQHPRPMLKIGREYYFFGYRCSRCHKVFLVPDSIKNVDDIPAAMWHECKESEHGR